MAADDGFSSQIEREIFNAGLSVETISLYLLCCGLLDAGASPTLDLLRSRWNASEQKFQESLDELLAKKILFRSGADGAERTEFRPMACSEWRL